MTSCISNILSNIYNYMKILIDNLECKKKSYHDSDDADETVFFSNMYKSKIHSND